MDFFETMRLPRDYGGQQPKRSKTLRLQVIEHSTIAGNWIGYITVFVIFTALYIVIHFLVKSAIVRALLKDTDEDDIDRLLNSESVRAGIQRINVLLFSTGSQSYEEAHTEEQDSGWQEEPQLGQEGHVNLNSGATDSLRAGSRSSAIISIDDIRRAAGPTTTVVSTPGQRNTSRELPESLLNVSPSYNTRYMMWWMVRTEFDQNAEDSRLSEVAFIRNMLIVAIFLALPAIELIRSYLTVEETSGSEDFCYYNFRCLTSVGVIPDFSRVFTNFGYFWAGISFYKLTKAHKTCASSPRLVRYQNVGINRTYGLFTSLAVGLCLQGIMSVLYHMCPNHITVRIDLVFSYLLCIICIIGIWGFRHGDVSHHVYPTIAVVSVFLTLAEAQELLPKWFFWLILGGFHLILLISTTFMMARYGTWSFHPLYVLRVLRAWRFLLRKVDNLLREEEIMTAKLPIVLRIAIAILLNVGAMTWGILLEPEPYDYILIICILNLCLYFCNYVFAKTYVHKERGTLVGWVSFVLAIIFWIVALTFFFRNNTDYEMVRILYGVRNASYVLKMYIPIA